VRENGNNQWEFDGNENENKAKPGSENGNGNESLGMGLKSHSRSSLLAMYRPISLTFVISKIMEKISTSKLINHLHTNNILHIA